MPDSDQPTASLKTLRFRADLLRRLRAFFDERGFLEVETPLLSADTVVDRHLDPIPVSLPDDRGRAGRAMFLQTSPEFAMKRLLAAGAESIYQICRAFRSAERGALHNTEFTMLEWYRVGDDYAAGMEFLVELTERLTPWGPPRRLSYAAAFQEHVGLDPHRAAVEALSAAASRLGLDCPREFSESRDDWLDLLMVERVQPRVAEQHPVILFDYPASQAALARIRADDPPVAERFELIMGGVELANGYHELLDPGELVERNRKVNDQRDEAGKPRLPEESRLLNAMSAGLPPCSGVALGIDRFVMLLCGARTIDEVIAFPIERA